MVPVVEADGMAPTTPGSPTVDHAVFAWDDLEAVEAVLADLGLTPDYGGAHGDGTTHMSLLGFDDGSYVEFIAGTDVDEPPVRWPDEIAGRAGPCSWALVVDDVAGQLKRLLDRGASVSGPNPESRKRSDGTLVEWATGVYTVGSGDAGIRAGTARDVLPFFIEDRTPRRYRVRPSRSVAGGPLTGVEHAVVAVESLDETGSLFRRFHGYPTPRRTDDESLDARLAWFPGRPAMLAAPLADDGWIAERLEQFGPGPCAFLIGTEDIGVAADVVPLTGRTEWAGRGVAWLDADPFVRRLGVVEVGDGGPPGES
jgi:hypothetical protein